MMQESHDTRDSQDSTFCPSEARTRARRARETRERKHPEMSSALQGDEGDKNLTHNTDDKCINIVYKNIEPSTGKNLHQEKVSGKMRRKS